MKFYKIGSYYIPENSINYILELIEGTRKTYVINFGNDSHINVSAGVAKDIGIGGYDGETNRVSKERQNKGKKAQ
jgi:hypothetical protein